MVLLFWCWLHQATLQKRPFNEFQFHLLYKRNVQHFECEIVGSFVNYL